MAASLARRIAAGFKSLGVHQLNIPRATALLAMSDVILSPNEQERLIAAVKLCLDAVDKAGVLTDDEYFSETYGAVVEVRGLVEAYLKLKSQAG